MHHAIDDRYIRISTIPAQAKRNFIVVDSHTIKNNIYFFFDVKCRFIADETIFLPAIGGKITNHQLHSRY